VRYLEARFIAIGKAQGRARLLNGNDATQVSLPEGDSPIFHLRLKKWSVEATAQVVDGGAAVFTRDRVFLAHVLRSDS